MSKCPICGKALVQIYHHGCEWGTEESKYECPGHCAEIFAYGSTEIHIGDFVAHLHYSYSEDQRNRINKIIDLIAEQYKEV